MSRAKLVLSPTAIKNIDHAHAWIKKRSKQGARLWHRTLLAALKEIQLNPKQFPLAEESATLRIKLQQSIFGTRTGQPYRILFSVERNLVRIHFPRGPGQDFIEPGSVK